MRQVGEALGVECQAEDVAVLLGPGLNIKRTPLCGRNFEYFSEDPYLSGQLAAALVEGVQASGVGACPKHFAANNQETNRLTVSVEADERTLREIYLPAFEAVVRQARPWTVMCSYNKINGVYASQNHWLLTEVLRDEWGFDGLAMSDWGAVDNRAWAVAAGLDLEMPSSGGHATGVILEAVRAGTLSEADVDRAAGRVLRLARRAQDARAGLTRFDAEAHHALALRAAQASAVLLKNEGVLPVDPKAGRLAVIGELARTPRYQGAGSSLVNPTRLSDALSALRALAPDLAFAPGYTLDGDAPDPALAAEAVEAARQASTVLLFLGLPAACESEGFDRDHMDLPAAQNALVEAVLDVNPNVAVVLSNGSALTLPWADRVPAVLEGWLLGQAGGQALADLLTGAASPSGKLAETIPLGYLDTPAVGNFPGEQGQVRYGEGLLVGYRWYDARQLPVAFPFGHGLTYTTFDYSALSVEVADAAAARVDVGLTVTNTGPRPGTETVQLYVADPVATVMRPTQELKAFGRVDLAPGESRRMRFALDSRAFAWWSPRDGRWVVEGGRFELRVGASSRDIRLRAEIELPGDAAAPALTAKSPLGEWLAHPAGGPLLRQLFDASGSAGLLGNPELMTLMSGNPLDRLCRFPGVGVTDDALAALVERAQAAAT